MDNLLKLALEAHNSEINVHRHYVFIVGQDLFGDWNLTIRWGKVGQTGQVKRYASKHPSDIQEIIRDRLRRRLSAPKRIGCAYQIARLSAATIMDASEWLPKEMATYFEKNPMA